MKRVTVVGAGFSGLVSAFYLVRAGYSVTLHESQPKAGGLIQTLQTPHGLVETAANAFLNSSLVEELFRAVNVPMIGTKREARRRFIFRRGRSRRWPLGLLDSLRVARFLVQYFFARKVVVPLDGESVRVWANRTVGIEASESLVFAALQGIYAGDPARLSARLILGRFFSPTKSSKPLPRLRGSVAPPAGMSQLMTGLEAYLRSQGVRFHFDSNFQAPSHIDQPIVLATNPLAAAKWLTDKQPEKAAVLNRIEMSPIVSTTAFFARTDPSTEGFGVLFPPIENRRALGVLKNSYIFEGRAEFSETWIQGGALAKIDPTKQSDGEILTSIVVERADLFQLPETPVDLVITRWPQGIPHYTLELEKMIPSLERADDNIFLMGNYLGDLGLAKILERASKLPARLDREAKWK
jgi:oxygen-dependent protoporphyrinogen oxidase